MAVSVAEYLGQRTDCDTTIQPVYVPESQQVLKRMREEGTLVRCPFTCGNPCKKVNSKNEPICSVRNGDGTLWINCSDRLCATKKDLPLSAYQSSILLQIAKHIFSPNVTMDDVCIQRETKLSVSEGTDYNADYIMTLRNGKSPYSGPDRLVVEMQGGGETSNTGTLTGHVKRWRENPSNAFLRQSAQASTLETNAWRRQQEQFIVKGNIAMKTWKGYGMAFCVGTLLYDYLRRKIADANLPDLRRYNWTLALLAFKEDDSLPPTNGPIPLIIDEERMLFTNYQTFVQALINQGEPTVDAFGGNFLTLNNEQVYIPIDGSQP